MTRDELLEVVYRFYPRGLHSYDPAYAASEERLRLAEAACLARVAYPTWKEMIRRLGARHRVQNESNFLLAGHLDPAYSARLWLTDERALSFHVCFLGPYYGIHHSGAPDEVLKASDLAREIVATYPGYRGIPPELGNEVVPEVDPDGGPFGQGTIHDCLFSEVWKWVGARSRSPEEAAAELASEAHRAARLARIATALAAVKLAPMERAHLDALAEMVADIAGRMASVEDSPAELATLRGTIASALERTGLPLTEAAWQWIMREEDREVLRFLAALATLEAGGVGADALGALLAAWRAPFEDRALCGAAVAAIRDELLFDAPSADG